MVDRLWLTRYGYQGSQYMKGRGIKMVGRINLDRLLCCWYVRSTACVQEVLGMGPCDVQFSVRIEVI